jgi:hypothetical protein
LLVHSAAKLEQKGKLDFALDQYLAAIRVSRQLRNWGLFWFADRIETLTYAHLSLWATRAGQTPERILRAARQIDGVTADISPSLAAKLDYLCRRRLLDGDLNALGDMQLSPFEVFWLHLPWEHARALRMLNYHTQFQLVELSNAEQAARNGQRFPCSSPWSAVPESRFGPQRPYTWIDVVVHGSPFIYPPRLQQVNTARDYTTMETSRRAVRLILALEAWKLQHGSLPKTLDELVGPCLDRLPVDPCSGMSFRYLRDGLKIPLQWNQPLPLAWNQTIACTVSGHVAANVPFIWTAGAYLNETGRRDNVAEEYEVFAVPGGPPGFHRPHSEYEVWSAGWPFSIP